MFCEVHNPEWNGDGAWTRVAYIDMRDPDQECPFGLALWEPYLVSPTLRVCTRAYNNGCSSTSFHTLGLEYSRVCGRVIGYQNYNPENPFYGYETIENATLEAPYVEGVSLTYGRLPRKHIWTFANAPSDDYNLNFQPSCECETSKPPFIGSDYFCDTGSRSAAQYTFYVDDPCGTARDVGV